MSKPFDYPPALRERRHGPVGYSDYRRYRPWLRDEFCFRCVYCLNREQWGLVTAAYDIDHFIAQARDPSSTLEYDNLLYACRTCNAAKGAQPVPDPCLTLIESDVRVESDGSIIGLTPDARRIILKLGLDDPDHTRNRKLWLDIIDMALANRELHVRLLGFPVDLPNLRKRTPLDNRRPAGIEQSYFAKAERGELPETY